MNIGSLVEEYLGWNEREKWLILRQVAYDRLRNILFSSPDTVNNISETDFRRDYLSFGTIVMNHYEYKVTPNTVPRFLNRFTVSTRKKCSTVWTNFTLSIFFKRYNFSTLSALKLNYQNKRPPMAYHLNP